MFLVRHRRVVSQSQLEDEPTAGALYQEGGRYEEFNDIIRQ